MPQARLANRVAQIWARPRYRHVISLGYFCSTALELQRYGLRDGSYPFDWNITPIRSALAMVESGFKGFLRFDRLSPEPGRVLDMGSGIYVYNDFDMPGSIAEQYEVVSTRYARRIERFQRAIMQPTLFVRYIDTEIHEPGPSKPLSTRSPIKDLEAVDCEPALNLEEFEYLDENMAAVLAVLRRANPHNDLLLVGNAGLPAVCGGLQVYAVATDEGDWVAREFLQKNPQLRRRLVSLHYPLGLRAANLLRHWWPVPRIRRRLALRTRLRKHGGWLKRVPWA